jgi:hypothetical protein
MSENATATPEPAAKNSAGADNFVSLADAIDSGFDALDKSPASDTVAEFSPTISQPVSERVAERPVEKAVEPSKTDASANTNPLDILTKRLTGKEEINKTETISDDLDTKAPDNLKPEAQTAWARLTKDLRDARAKIKEFETKSSEAPKDSVEQIDLKAQLDSLKQERDEYENELRFARLESTREYKQAVTEPLNSIQKEVSEIADLYEGVDPRNIYAAMVEPDVAKRRALLKEATASLDPVDSLSIRNKAEELQKVFERRDLLTKDVQTVLQMLDSDQKQYMENLQKQSQAELEVAYKTEWENLQKENAILRPIEGNEAWNNTISNIQQEAMKIEDTELDPRSKARLTFNAAAMPVVMSVFQDYVSKAQSRITELEKLTKELRSVSPSAGAEKGSAPEISSDLGFLEALERGLK